MGTQKAASKLAGKTAGKSAAKSATKGKGSSEAKAKAEKGKPSRLATIKNAILGLGGAKKKPGASAPVEAKAKANGKGGAAHTTVSNGNAKALPKAVAGAAPAAVKNGKAARGAAKGNSAAGAQARGKAASQALSQIASAKSGGKPIAVDSDSVCREVACEGLATSGGYCRLHYIKNWKKIQRKAQILREGKLNQYIEELVAKYPDKYIEAIRQDLANDKDFAKVIYDLDLDESVDEFTDVEGENVDSLIDNIKREFDDEGESF